ncbi:hypothetical protein PPROV_000769800 [Pycnococcus provasolii]|uniref:Uncharacterized protein n=1 Tax=Pycnococcus provasolii TaxID=41880 RepID=A0A830HTY3_9CHLO|nr:hypothetical protein PPROV_000769800 [Pycnococcus provasolii]|mmetsp:Transcript_6927/g.17955  ORF Transcript_6927/g.17955 Transcript_6927/m.17955 type:complete len:337 (-) Transcript_6927:159-1169(-)
MTTTQTDPHDGKCPKCPTIHTLILIWICKLDQALVWWRKLAATCKRKKCGCDKCYSKKCNKRQKQTCPKKPLKKKKNKKKKKRGSRRVAIPGVDDGGSDSFLDGNSLSSGSTGEDDVGSSSAVGVSRGSSGGRGGRNLLSVPNSASSGEMKPIEHHGTSGYKSNKCYTNLHLCKGFEATIRLTEKALKVLKKWKRKKPKNFRRDNNQYISLCKEWHEHINLYKDCVRTCRSTYGMTEKSCRKTCAQESQYKLTKILSSYYGMEARYVGTAMFNYGELHKYIEKYTDCDYNHILFPCKCKKKDGEIVIHIHKPTKYTPVYTPKKPTKTKKGKKGKRG